MGRDRRATDTPARGRPSGVAGQRLAARLRAEVADVRVRLEEATLRTDALLATGQRERAAEVMGEQQDLLEELRETLSSTVAAAMIEAEAEAVLAGSPDAPSLFGDPAERDRIPTPASGRRRSVRAMASGFVSAAAAVALLLVTAPLPTPEALSAADRTDAPGDAASADRVDGGAAQTTVGTEATTAPSDLDIGRLLARRAPRGGAAQDVLMPGLSRFQALVDQFVATVVRVAGGLAPGAIPASPLELTTADAATATSGAAGEPPVLARVPDERPAAEPTDPSPSTEDGGSDASETSSETETEGSTDDTDEEGPLGLPSEDGAAGFAGFTEFE